MKSLVLTEKPSVAREIARVLGCGSKGKGYFEGPKYVVTWALGHLVTLAEPEDYDLKFKSWNLQDLPMLPEKMKLKVIKQTSQQYRTVKDLMKRQDISDMVIATDAGREGELVARWIMVLGGWRKPFKRLWISSQTDDAIRSGFSNLKPGNEYNNLFDAAVCRAEADWIIGLNITRALSCKHNAQLTAGRVQTPTLAMMVKREQEIKNFVPVDYWTIRADFGDYYGDWRSKDGGRIYEGEKVEQILSKLKGHPGVIRDVKAEIKSEAAPLLYDLTELQRDANRRYGFAAQKTSSVLQNLYERHKIVTYPRTDSRYLSADIVPTLAKRLQAISVGAYAEPAQLLQKSALKISKRFVDDSKVSDHHAIIPTEQPLKLSELTADEKNLYDLIVRRFLAQFYPTYRYELVTLVTQIHTENFFSRGKSVIDQGWRGVAFKQQDKEDHSEDSMPEQTLGRLKIGESRDVKSLKANKAKTKPPSRYTEATLLTAMENPGKFIEDEELRESMKGSGLGTPATRADIIEKLLKTFYIERNGKELTPTSKGIQLISLVAPELRSPELTAQWEQSLTDIARGKGNKKAFMTSIRQSATTLVQGITSDSSVYKADNLSKTKCPVCAKPMLTVNGKRGKTLVCQDRTCGYRLADSTNNGGFSSSKKDSRMNQKLIETYSDKAEIGNNLGELLKAALAKKNES